jgi:hypothetical protein
VPVELHPGIGPEGREHLLPLRTGELVEAELVVVAQERGPCVLGWDRGQRADDRLQRLGLLAGQGQPQLLVEHEGELHVELVAVLVPEVAGQVL